MTLSSLPAAIDIHIEQLTFAQSDTPALTHIDITIPPGQFVAITGDVASGKSTLLNCITGAVPKYHPATIDGTIEVDGIDVATIPLPQMCHHLGFMMQDPQSQIIDTSVYEEVAFGPGNLELPREEMDTRVHDALSAVGLAGFENRRTDTLSGGQAQRVVLAGLLALDPHTLILDQPTAELDPQGRRELYAHLGQLNQERGITIVMVMDRTEDVLGYADRVLVMDNGHIIRDELAFSYRQSLESHPTSSHPVAMDTDRDIVLQLDGVAHTYANGAIGCSPIDLTIKQGDCMAIAGVNGSGKTTLLKLIEGLLPPTAGSIHLFGAKLDKKHLAQCRSRMGFVFQNPDYQIFGDTVLGEVAFGLKLRRLPADTIQTRAMAALKSVGLAEYRDLHPQRLSRGQRQLLAIAGVLATEPDLVLADEPTSGLGEADGQAIMAQLRHIADNGRTVVIVTHDLAMAQNYCDRMVILHRHQMVADYAMTALPAHRDLLVKTGLVTEVSS